MENLSYDGSFALTKVKIAVRLYLIIFSLAEELLSIAVAESMITSDSKSYNILC